MVVGPHSRVAWIFGAMVLLAVPLFVQSPYYMHVLVMSALFVVISSGLNLILGYAGQLAFGYTAFFALGGYVTALLALHTPLPFWVNIVLGGTFSGIAAFFLGYPCLRLRGPYFAIMTFAFAEIIRLVANNWISLTRGPMGLSGIPAPTLAIPGLPTIGLGSETSFYYIALILAAAATYTCHRIVHSRYGRAFVGIRENEDLAAAVGVDPFRFKMRAWVASAVIGGIGGGAYAYYIQVVDPVLFSFYFVFVVFTMVIVGGRGTILGPIVGGLLLTILPESLRLAQSYRMMIFAFILLVCMLFFPQGIVGWWHQRAFDRGRSV